MDSVGLNNTRKRLNGFGRDGRGGSFVLFLASVFSGIYLSLYVL